MAKEDFWTARNIVSGIIGMLFLIIAVALVAVIIIFNMIVLWIFVKKRGLIVPWYYWFVLFIPVANIYIFIYCVKLLTKKSTIPI